MRVLVAVVMVMLATCARASGYGWYVESFDWESYEKAKPTIQGRYAQLAKKAFPAETRETHLEVAKNMAFGGCCEGWSEEMAKLPLRAGPLLAVKDESPQHLEFYWPEALRYASRKNAQAGAKPNYFLYFRYGRSYLTGRPIPTCGGYDWGYCLGATIILSPDEVKEFHGQVAALNSTIKHPANYRDYLIHLEQMLARNANGKRGLHFEGHD